jgi:capsular polysaccharide biosynthesis protein
MTDNETPRQRTSPLARVRALPPWSLVAAGVVLGGLAGGGYGVLHPPAYTATSYVVAVPAERSDTATALGFAQAFGRVATEPAVLGDARVWARVPVRTLRDDVRSATSPDAPMVAISATSRRPAQAADMANAVARALVEHANTSKGDTHVSLVQFSRAVKPIEPSSLSAWVTGLIGVSAGGLLGALGLLARPGRRAEGQESAHAASVPGPAVAADAQGRL